MTNFTHAKYGPDTVRIDDPTYVVPLLTEDITVGTGLAFPAADTVAIEAGGVEKARFTSTLNSLAGVTTLLANSASAALTVTQTGAGNAFVVEDSASTDSTPFVVTAGGEVGVGGTPDFAGKAQKVLITDNTYATIFVEGTSTTAAVLGQFSTNATGASYQLRKARGSVAVPTVVAADDDLGTVFFQGYDGTTYRAAASILGEVDGTPGASDMPGRLVFSTTADGVSGPTERMRIDSVGNVGFGRTPSVQVKTDIGGTYPTSGAESYGLYVRGTGPAATTGNLYGIVSQQNTEDAAFTVTNIRQFTAFQGTITGGSRLTPISQFGFVADSGLTGATNNYGFYGNLAAATGRWNFYAGGTAQNYFAGCTGVGTLPATTTVLKLAASTTGVSSLNVAHGAAPTTPVDGDIWTTTAGLFVRINGATVGPLS